MWEPTSEHFLAQDQCRHCLKRNNLPYWTAICSEVKAGRPPLNAHLGGEHIYLADETGNQGSYLANMTQDGSHHLHGDEHSTTDATE